MDTEKGEQNLIPMDGYINYYDSTENNNIWPLLATDTSEYSEDMKYGYIGMDGKWIIEPAYSQAREFHGNYAAVKTEDGLFYFIDKTGEIISEEGYSNIYFNDFEDDKSWCLYNNNTNDEKYLDISLQPLAPTKHGWYSDGYYYKNDKINGLPKNYEYAMFHDDYVLVFYDWDDETIFWYDISRGKGKEINKRYDFIHNLGDYYIASYYSERGNLYYYSFDVYNRAGKIAEDTIFHRFPSIASRFKEYENMMFFPSDEYLWVTTAQNQGYIDHEGNWIYRESRFHSLID